MSAVLLPGVLWGVAVSLLETVAIPPATGDPTLLWRLPLWILPGWCLVGVCLFAWVCKAGDRLERPLFFAASVAGCAFGLSALWSALYAIATLAMPASAMSRLFPHGPNPVASYAYQTWVVAFYGGLTMFAWTLGRRIERSRRLLAQAGLATIRAQAELAEVQLDALRGHVDPRFLLRVMVEVERRYAAAPRDADRLVGQLVAFLRLAMPGVRSGRATLAGELALAHAYGELGAEIEPRRGAWQVVVPATLPDVAFPPLQLLAVLDRLGGTLATGTPIRIEVTCAAGTTTLRIDDDGRAGAGWLDPGLAYRMRVGLSTLHGSNWTLEVRESPAESRPALELRITGGPGRVPGRGA